MVANIHVTNARLMAEEKPVQEIRVTNARLMAEEKPVQVIRVTNARIMVEYVLSNAFVLSATLDNITLSGTITNEVTAPPSSSTAKKAKPQLQWIGRIGSM